MPKLKVFRTAIGFHDAYVAATSRKAALAAWGSDKDLFARGVAEEVTDPALTAEPLAVPGKVVRRSRGSTAEQLAALPPATKRRRRPAVEPEPPVPARHVPKPKPTLPPPSREALDAAEAALARAARAGKDALADLAAREAALARERRALEREQADTLRRLTRARDAAQAEYDAALRGRG